jgi:hypothetical protein
VTKADKPWKHMDRPGSPAEAAYAHMLEDYPKSAISWMRDATWTGPQEVPLADIEYQPDKW